MIFDVAKMDLP